jgi:hypothetical protein
LTSTGSTGFGSLTTTEVDAVENDIKSAQILVAGATTAGTTNLDDISINGESITSLTVYTPIPVGASQEFLTVTLAEPPSPALLGTDLLALAGLILIARRRWASSAV